MSVWRLVLSLALSAGVWLLGGCGESPEAPPPYNRPLGGAAEGAPPGVASVDTGILEDQSSYQPANYPSVSLAGGGVAAAGDTQPQAQIRARLAAVLNAPLELDFDTLLEAFVPEQVEPLRPHVSALYELADKIQVLNRTVAAKRAAQGDAGPAAAEAFDALALKYLRRGVAVVSGALTIEVLDAQNAAVGVDLPKLVKGAASLREQFEAELAERPELAAFVAGAAGPARGMLGGGGAPGREEARATGAAPRAAAGPDARSPTPPYLARLGNLIGALGGAGEAGQVSASLPLKYVDGQWRIQLPLAITPERAEVVGQALALAQDFTDRLNAKIDTVQTLGLAELLSMGFQTYLELNERVTQVLAGLRQAFGRGATGQGRPGSPAARGRKREQDSEGEGPARIIRP